MKDYVLKMSFFGNKMIVIPNKRINTIESSIKILLKKDYPYFEQYCSDLKFDCISDQGSYFDSVEFETIEFEIISLPKFYKL
jgi:hypothetical protein